MDGVHRGLCFELHYHPGRANVVADALSRKSISDIACVAIREWEMLGALGEFDLLLSESAEVTALFSVVAQPTLVKGCSWIIYRSPGWNVSLSMTVERMH